MRVVSARAAVMGAMVPARAAMVTVTKFGSVVSDMIARKIVAVMIPMIMAQVVHDGLVRRLILDRNDSSEWHRGRGVQRLKGKLGLRNVTSDEVGVSSFRTKHGARIGSEALTQTMQLDGGENLRRRVPAPAPVSLD